MSFHLPTVTFPEHIVIPHVLQDSAQGKILCLQVVPAVRISVEERFGEPIATICPGKIISDVRIMGFQFVFDTNYGADLTIILKTQK
jgi:NADH-quinone oxidoreductase subunit G